jgi:hypothetical protein
MSIEARLERMEQQMRRWKRIAAFMLAAGMVLGIAGGIVLTGGGKVKADCDTLVAQRFLLTDATGTVRGEWKLIDGEPFLQMTGTAHGNPAKHSAVALGINHDQFHTARINVSAGNGFAALNADDTVSMAWVGAPKGRDIQLLAGENSDPVMTMTYNGKVQMHAVAHGSETEVLVRTNEQTVKTLKVP